LYYRKGDFNTVLTGLDKKNGNLNAHKNCRKLLTDLIATNELSDIWRIKHPDKNQFTWHSNCKLHIFCRLDFFLISNNLCNLISKCNIKPGYKTDHSLVQLNIDNLLLGKGRGYFKVNNSILLDVEYQNKIKQSINDITNLTTECNPNTMWELIKSTIRNETIQYCSIKNKKSKKEEEVLIAEITTLQQNLINCNSADNMEHITNTIKVKQQELEQIYDKKINGYILRSKAIQVEGNEKNSAYFANLEKRKAEKKTIHKLVVDNKVLKDKDIIIEAEVNYCESLYKQNHIEENVSDLFLMYL